MSESQSPLNWGVPAWHPDFGNAEAECEHLRQLALAVLSTVPHTTAELIVPEPGLMLLRIVMPDGAAVEAYSLDAANGPENRRYGLFLSPGTPKEQESYAISVSQALRILQGAPPENSETPTIDSPSQGVESPIGFGLG